MTEPIIVPKGPFFVEVEAGAKYSWCTCGMTGTEPFCDGSHKGLGTGLKSLPFFPEKSGIVKLCGCKQTKNPPYCDGSHNNL